MAIFPLPTTVFFPGASLPLHLFEPRYLQMAEDVLSEQELLVVVLLREGWEQDYYGNPAVHDIATVGRIEASEKLDDGRYNIVVEGLERVRLLPARGEERVGGRLYRRRSVEPAPEHPCEPSTERSALGERLLAGFLELEEKSGTKPGASVRSDLPFDRLVNRIASVLDVPPPMKQRLLEEDDLLGRAALLETYLDETLRFWRTLARFRGVIPDDPRVN